MNEPKFKIIYVYFFEMVKLMLVTILCCRHHDGDCLKIMVAKSLFGDFWLVFRLILRISNIRQHSKQYQKSVTNIDVTMEVP